MSASDTGKSEPADPGWLTSLRRSRSWMLVSAALAVLAIGASSYYLVTKFLDAVRQIASLNVRVRPLFLLLSLLTTMACVFLGGIIWTLVLRGVGATAEWDAGMRSHLLANLGGYLPGYGWQLVGKGYLTGRQGVPMGLVSFAVALEFAGLAITRAAVALTTMPQSALIAARWDPIIPYVPWMRIAAWCLLFSSPFLLQGVSLWVRRGNPGRQSHLSMNKSLLWLVLAIMCFNWLLYGVGFALLIHSLYDIAPRQVGTIVFSTTTSFLVSLLMFFVPAGIGVRESVMIYTLERTLPAAIVTVSALASRAVLLLAELLGALVGSWMSLRSRLRK